MAARPELQWKRIASFTAKYAYNNLGYAKQRLDVATNQVHRTANAMDAEQHILQQTAGNGLGFFSQLGINIDDYTVTLGQTTHLQGIHGSGLGDMPGGWNSQWGSFISQNPNATAPQVYQQAGQMMDRYGIGDLRIHPYRQ